MNNKIYDALNNVVKLVLPGIGTLYFTFASIWHLPYGEQVVGSFAALATFLGLVITVAKRSWSTDMDGTLSVDVSDPSKDVYSLSVNVPLDELAQKDALAIKVQKY
jgi:hypothetical protein